ncbi:hypothetical protein [Paramicrobacterium fandaimingii]|uniref:hypothetical protein n=1 Tax=Paramicrobacterium fandaimingii TaxID=2708079 RepID=UPI00142238F3|nr:hypothetical protein [Microbacterium fandaimingii]
MKTSRASSPRRRRIVIIAAGVVFLLLAGVGIYGLITGPDTTAPADDTTSPTATAPPDDGTAPGRIPAVPASDDPEEFARGFAEALFAWDTASGFMPLDYTAVLLDAGDPTGIEQAGLAADIAHYFPTRDAWVGLRKHGTRQHLSIDTAVVPEAWAEAEAQARPGQLAPGTTAITIDGTRHRDGIWNNEPVTSEHEVAFTIFLRCPTDPTPTSPTSKPSSGESGEGRVSGCHVLRLSQLDNPLR